MPAHFLFLLNALKCTMLWTDACRNSRACKYMEYLLYSLWSTHQGTNFLHPEGKMMRITQPHTAHIWGCPQQHHLIECHLKSGPSYGLLVNIHHQLFSQLTLQVLLLFFHRQKWPFMKDFPFHTSNSVNIQYSVSHPFPVCKTLLNTLSDWPSLRPLEIPDFFRHFS